MIYNTVIISNIPFFRTARTHVGVKKDKAMNRSFWEQGLRKINMLIAYREISCLRYSFAISSPVQGLRKIKGPTD